MVLSLLELAFSKTPLSYKTIYLEKKYGDDSVYHDIYDRVVRRSRERIRLYMSNKNMKLILRCIYLARTKGIMELSNEILGCLINYKGSLFRLGLVYAVGTYVEANNNNNNNTTNKMILDIMGMCDMILPPDSPRRDKVYEKLIPIANYRDNDIPIDLMMIVDCYMAFGDYLYPYVIVL